ncbi:MAG: hypothetical protein ACUZ77_08860 [Candidatus Brocadiales bacterium]
MSSAGACVLNYREVLEVDNTSVGEGDEASTIREERTDFIGYYLLPISIQRGENKAKFLALKAKWEAETAMLSSTTEISMHWAYQEIIGMGPSAVPLILSEMKKELGHWFWALKSITGEDPVPPEKRGRIKEMTKAWLRWGREKGYHI